jgi:hypothetical protein
MKEIGRLALREEGNRWVAYYALAGTMEGAITLASIAIADVERPERKQAFMDLMRDVVADILEGKLGTRPVWGGPIRAPERERAGSA